MDTRYVCSECGYSRSSTESVVAHVAREHDGRARVMEAEVSGSLTRIGRAVRRVKRWMG